VNKFLLIVLAIIVAAILMFFSFLDDKLVEGSMVTPQTSIMA
jgi:hypothetical protein